MPDLKRPLRLSPSSPARVGYRTFVWTRRGCRSPRSARSRRPRSRRRARRSTPAYRAALLRGRNRRSARLRERAPRQRAGRVVLHPRLVPVRSVAHQGHGGQRGEAPHVLDGLFYHQFGLVIEQHAADTGGIPDHVFGLAPFFSYGFASRMRDLRTSACTFRRA
ncbi:hypothetical protein CKY28_17935 [Sphingomonas lenta]|uniref:Tn3 transposase DDE domain-containing protein n=1 Tax=Sphingomonas lenta TaxID=1141887 RepID=A0A2A2SAS3_9SPHN|nr:hypothetical protein CKY28_17935 [Sphingomonas lenta]